MKTVLTSCLVWLSILGSTSFAAIVNGGFEDTPTFVGSGWDTLGVTAISGNYFGVAAPSGNNQALLRTGDGGSGGIGESVANLAAFLQVSQADINAVAPNAFNGSAIRQTINVSAGDTLEFEYNFMTTEGSAVDAAFISLGPTGAPPTLFVANTNSPSTNDPVGIFPRQTGYKDFSHSFAVGGSYVLGIVVVNATDAVGQSGLLIDNVRVAVPEPSALAGLGLLGLTLTMRRRRKTR